MTIRFDNIFFIPFYLMINMFSTFPTFSARLSLIWPCRTCDSKLSTGEIAWQPNVSSQGNNQKMYPIRNVFIITTVLGDRVIWKRNINDIVQYLGVLKIWFENIFFFQTQGKSTYWFGQINHLLFSDAEREWVKRLITTLLYSSWYPLESLRLNARYMISFRRILATYNTSTW